MFLIFKILSLQIFGTGLTTWQESARKGGYKSEQCANKETALGGPTNCLGFVKEIEEW